MPFKIKRYLAKICSCFFIPTHWLGKVEFKAKYHTVVVPLMYLWNVICRISKKNLENIFKITDAMKLCELACKTLRLVGNIFPCIFFIFSRSYW